MMNQNNADLEQYEDDGLDIGIELGTLTKPQAAQVVAAAEPDPRSTVEEAIAGVLDEISDANGERHATTSTLQFLVQSSKENNPQVWEGEFNSILSVVLELLSDPEPDVRDLALRVLREMLKNQTAYFDQSITLVVARLLERHQEQDREVLRSAEETLNVLSNVMAPTTCARILEPIILADDGSVLLAAIKLLTKVLKKMTQAEMATVIEVCIPGIIKGYKHPMAEVRKGVVFALVEMYLTLGPGLKEHLGYVCSCCVATA